MAQKDSARWRRHASALAAALAGLALVSALPATVIGRAHARGWTDREVVISLPGVPGPYCIYGIDKRLRQLTGVQRIDVLWAQEKIRVRLAAESRVTTADVIRAVERSEYAYRYTVSGP